MPFASAVIQGYFPHGHHVKSAPLPAHLTRFPTTGGQPLPPFVLQRMEAVFGTRFQDVRVHVTPQAAALGAIAFTHGANVHFAPGQYNPASAFAQRVLAHELAHVVQQRAGRVRNPFGSGVAVIHDSSLELEAERMAIRASVLTRMPLQAKFASHVIQRASAVVAKPAYVDGVLVEPSSNKEVPANVLSEVRAMMKAAAAKKGAANSNDALKTLETILAVKAVKDAQPKSSEATYAVGSVGTAFYASGPSAFTTAAIGAAGSFATTTDVGSRDDFVHGESFLLTKGAMTAVAATQAACLFCYGYLEKQGIAHQTLRASPFPKGWIHPSMNFKLTQVNPNNGPKGALLWITYDGAERLYRYDAV